MKTKIVLRHKEKCYSATYPDMIVPYDRGSPSLPKRQQSVVSNDDASIYGMLQKSKQNKLRGDIMKLKNRLISFLLTLSMLAVLIPGLGIEAVAASHAPAKLLNPAISPKWVQENMYTGRIENTNISPVPEYEIRWTDVGQEFFNVAVKVLDGEPNPGSENEPGQPPLFGYEQGFQGTSVNVDLTTAAGKWVKVFIQAVFSDGHMTGGHYYFKVSGKKFPYPSLLDFSALQQSFDKIARKEIAKDYQDYVLNSIKYHILSSTDDYRVAKNILRLFKGNDQNVVFFFDGCSANLEDAEAYTTNTTDQAGGYKIGKNTYNTSAVCIVVRANEKGQAYIAFATRHAATLPDQVRVVKDKYRYDPNYWVTDVGCVKDGVYNIAASTMGEKVPAALRMTQGSSTTLDAIRANLENATLLNSTISGVYIHRSWSKTIDWSLNQEKGATSIGCLIVGNDENIYNAFIEAVTGHSKACSTYFSTNTKTPDPYNVLSGQSIGAVVIDRTSYIDKLGIIYGNDPAGYTTGLDIAKYLTEKSQVWHTAVADMPEHTHVYLETNYEAAHPHAVYLKCFCGDIMFDGNTQTVSGCIQCFTDVDETDTYYDAVKYVSQNKLMVGVTTSKFAPDKALTRAMIMTILGRVDNMGKLESSRIEAIFFGNTDFSDVEPGTWYAPYVEWGRSAGIVKGYDDQKFGPNDELTIEAALVFLYRYAEMCGYSSSQNGASISKYYSDYKSVSGWATDAMQWAINEGIYVPESRYLNPQKPASRALVATMICNFADKLKANN